MKVYTINKVNEQHSDVSSVSGVIARNPLYFPYLKKCLTAEMVEKFFQHLIKKGDDNLPCVTR